MTMLNFGIGKYLNLSAIALVGTLLLTNNVQAATESATPPPIDWTFTGVFGTFDKDQLRRGYAVYSTLCASCHGLKRINFRNLMDPGGPAFSENEVKAMAADAFEIEDGPDEFGEMFERTRTLADPLPSPFANDNAAKAAFNGVAPPDLSLMTKARGYSRGFPQFLFDAVTPRSEALGADYVHAILTGYEEAPADRQLDAGQYWNHYFPGNIIAMPQPLQDDFGLYEDGSPETIEQYATDVTAFLMWAAEPKLEERKRLGFQVLMFLIVFAGLMYAVKRKLWSKVPH